MNDKQLNKIAEVITWVVVTIIIFTFICLKH